MNNVVSLRSISVLALAPLALAAHAVDAYSNYGSPASYTNQGYFINTQNLHAFQFTATASGTLSGFQIAMNNFSAGTSQPFTLNLYGDNGANQEGVLLGTYGGNSTGTAYSATTSALVSVAASGATPSLASGTKYWLEASSAASLIWSEVASGSVPAKSNSAYMAQVPGAYSVQVSPVPEPSALAALGLGGLAALRRRRRA